VAKVVKMRTKQRTKRLSEKHDKLTEVFEVRDLREFGFFTIDNVFLDGKWLKLLKGCPAAAYFSLCRHCDRTQLAFPGIEYLADESGYSDRHVRRAIKILEFHRLISVDREHGDHNIYTLLNRKHWRKTAMVKTEYRRSYKKEKTEIHGEEV
jgi:hypothetical protein